MSMNITEKLIQRQINHWNQFREFLREDKENGGVVPGPVVTVSRLAGSGGRALAVGLAERFRLSLHDHSLVDSIARERNLAPSVVDQLDEQAISQADLWVRGVLNRRIFMKEEYHTALVKVVTSLATAGNVIFLGRGAHLILRDKCTLRIRLVASWSNRLARIMERTGLSRAEARALLDETDRNREEFTRRVFKVEPNDPKNFDLVLNADRMSEDAILELATLALINATAGSRPGAPARA